MKGLNKGGRPRARTQVARVSGGWLYKGRVYTEYEWIRAEVRRHQWRAAKARKAALS